MSIGSSQHINLYQAAFQKQEEPLSAINLVRAMAGFVVLLSLVYAYQYFSLWGLESEVESLTLVETDAATQVQALNVKFGVKETDAKLDAEVTALGFELEAKSVLLNSLSSQNTGSVRGFARFMEALGRQRVYGVWLRKMNFRNGGRSVELEGSAVHPGLIPKLIQQLSTEAPFAGMEFKNFSIDRKQSEDEDTSFIDFTLSTGPIEEDKESAQ